MRTCALGFFFGLVLTGYGHLSHGAPPVPGLRREEFLQSWREGAEGRAFLVGLRQYVVTPMLYILMASVVTTIVVHDSIVKAGAVQGESGGVEVVGPQERAQDWPHLFKSQGPMKAYKSPCLKLRRKYKRQTCRSHYYGRTYPYPTAEPLVILGRDSVRKRGKEREFEKRTFLVNRLVGTEFQVTSTDEEELRERMSIMGFWMGLTSTLIDALDLFVPP